MSKFIIMNSIEVIDILRNNPETVDLLGKFVGVGLIIIILVLSLVFFKTRRLSFTYKRKDGKRKKEKTFSITAR